MVNEDIQTQGSATLTRGANNQLSELRPPANTISTASVGRRAALQVLDSMLLDEKNIHMLKEALQDEFNSDPVHFFRSLIVPLLPKEVTGQQAGNGAGGTQINIMMVEPEASASTSEKSPINVEVSTIKNAIDTERF